jgi:FAD-dependent urate hydroxylase
VEADFGDTIASRAGAGLQVGPKSVDSERDGYSSVRRNSPECDVAIIGAGPYGLSAAAHLRALKGLDSRIFGRPMSFWKEHMPVGMYLRSPLEGSDLSDPERKLTLKAYAKTNGNHLDSPLPLGRFVDYGCWFQQKVAADIDRRTVSRVEHDGTVFRLRLQDGEEVTAARVVVAGGIVPFARRPQQFQTLPAELASHSCENRDLRSFGSKRVMVIGGGQSALESAALLHEAGAEVRVVIREPEIHWTWQTPWLHTFKPVGRLLYASPDVGPAGISHVVAAPSWFRRLPRGLQKQWAERSIRPAGAGWLKTRLEHVHLTTGRCVASAVPSQDQLRIRLDDGAEHSVDHLLIATGYKVDISKYPFLGPELLTRIQTVDGYPVLDRGFGTSIPGLHFLGAPAAWSFGPLMRFVAGAGFATRTLARYMAPRKEVGSS